MKRAISKIKDNVMGYPSNASPTPSMVSNTRSHRQHLEEELEEDAPVEELMEVELETIPNFCNVEPQLNTDKDLDLAGKRERDI